MIDSFLPSFIGISSFDEFGTIIPQDDIRNGEIVKRLIDNGRLIFDLEFIVNNPYSSLS